MLHPINSTGESFKLLSGAVMQNSAGIERPYIHKVFFQCGRDQTCTQVAELSNGFVLVHGSIELEKIKYEAVRIYEKAILDGKSIMY